MQMLKFIDVAVVKNSDMALVKHMLFERPMSKTPRKIALLTCQLLKTRRKIALLKGQLLKKRRKIAPVTSSMS